MKKYSASDSTWNRSKKCPIRPTETEVALPVFKMWYFLPSNLNFCRRRKTGDDDAQIQLRVWPASSWGDFQTSKLLVFEDFFGFEIIIVCKWLPRFDVPFNVRYQTGKGNLGWFVVSTLQHSQAQPILTVYLTVLYRLTVLSYGSRNKLHNTTYHNLHFHVTHF